MGGECSDSVDQTYQNNLKINFDNLFLPEP